MAVKSWGDPWVIELLPPRSISFLLPLHLSAVAGHQHQQHTVLQASCWEKSFSTAASRSPRCWRQAATKECSSFMKHNKWRSRTRTGKWIEEWLTGEQSTDTALMSYGEALELRLYRPWLVLIEHLLWKPSPGPRVLWEGKEKTTTERKSLAQCLKLWISVNALLHQLIKQYMGFLFCSLKRYMKEALKTHGYLFQVVKNFCPTWKKQELSFPRLLQSERWKNT